MVDGGATAADWVLTADGTAANDVSGAGGISELVVVPDTFQLSESVGPLNYTAGEWDCTGGTLVGQELTLSLSEAVTCTIVNTYDPPIVIFDSYFALPALPDGDGAGTPVCVDDVSGLLVAGCDVSDQIDPTSVQKRVDGVCTTGYSIRVINADGSVVCEPDVDTVLSEAEVDSFVSNNGYSLSGHTHSAASITSGTLSTARYSAYADVSSEGKLDNNADSDLLTRVQADTRFLNDGGAQASTVFVDPASCQRGISSAAPYDKVEVYHSPNNAYGPGIGVSRNEAAGSYWFYCPVPDLHTPGGTVVITGATMGTYDGATTCLVGSELVVKTYFSSEFGSVLGSVYTGSNDTDYAPLTYLDSQSMPAMSHEILANQHLFVQVLVSRNSSDSASCRFTGMTVNYTLDRS